MARFGVGDPVRARVAVVAVAAVAVLLVSGCAADAAGPASPVGSATFSQQQAIPGFDDAEYVLDDEAELERPGALLRDHGVDGDLELLSDCDGALVTTVVWVDEADAAHRLVVDSCRDDAIRGDLESLVAQWRARGGWPLAEPGA